MSLPSRKVSEEYLGGDETEALCKTSHEQCILSKNSCQLYCFTKTSVGQPFINFPQICTIFITAKNVPSVINQDKIYLDDYLKNIFNQVSSSVWVNAADRSKSINLELLEEMFQIEEKEKAVNTGKLNVRQSGVGVQTNFKTFLMLGLLIFVINIIIIIY